MFNRVRDNDRDKELDEYRQATSERVARLEGEFSASCVATTQRMDRVDLDHNRLRGDFATAVNRLEILLQERFTVLDSKIDALSGDQALLRGIGMAVKWVIIIGGSSGVVGGLLIGAMRLLGGAHL